MIGRAAPPPVAAGRGVGITGVLQDQFEAVAPLFGLVTQLGDVWFLFLLGSALYVTGEEFPRVGLDRRSGLFVLGLALTSVALVGFLKTVFDLPRPPGAATPVSVEWLPDVVAAVLHDITTADGPGFPSGHALGVTMVWGGLALVVNRGSARIRFGIAAIVLFFVSVSRLVLGVHYAVDVVVGAALGSVGLGALYLASEHGTRPGRVLFVATAVGVAGILVHVSLSSVAAVGGAVGAWVAWWLVAARTPAHPSSRHEVLVGYAVLAVGGAIVVAVLAVEPPHPITFAATGIAVGAVVVAPLAGDRFA